MNRTESITGKLFLDAFISKILNVDNRFSERSQNMSSPNARGIEIVVRNTSLSLQAISCPMKPEYNRICLRTRHCVPCFYRAMNAMVDTIEEYRPFNEL
jgi:hypothetical protein